MCEGVSYSAGEIEQIARISGDEVIELAGVVPLVQMRTDGDEEFLTTVQRPQPVKRLITLLVRK